MRILTALALTSSLLLGACHGNRDAANAAFDYSFAYTRVVVRATALHPLEAMVQDAVAALGDEGRTLALELDTLTKRTQELDDMIARANTQATNARTRLDAEALRVSTGAIDAASKEAVSIETAVAVLRAKAAAAAEAPDAAVPAGPPDAAIPIVKVPQPPAAGKAPDPVR